MIVIVTILASCWIYLIAPLLDILLAVSDLTDANIDVEEEKLKKFAWMAKVLKNIEQVAGKILN